LHPPALHIGDYLSPLGFSFALLGFGFLRVIVTFTLATVSLLSTAFAKSCKAFAFFQILFEHCVALIIDRYLLFSKYVL